MGLSFTAFRRLGVDRRCRRASTAISRSISDEETALHYNYYRSYDAKIGRFISPDPIGFNGGVNFYAYVSANPVNRVDPLGLAESASPWQVGWEWLTGTGPRTHNFTDGDPFTELLKQHPHIVNLQKGVCDGSLPPHGRFDYILSGWKGVPKYLRDYSTLATGGLTGNLAVTYLGSYVLTYSASNGTINVRVTNSSTIASATHPPVIGYTRWWDTNIGGPVNNFFSSGPMSRTTQTFEFQVSCVCE